MKRIYERLFWQGKFYPVRFRTGPIPNPTGEGTYFHCFGLLLNRHALWIGAHYSSYHKRLCVNLLPGVTLWWAKPGGQLP